MPPGRQLHGGLVRRPRGGRKSKSPTPTPHLPPQRPRTPVRLPLDGPNFNRYREPVIPSPGDSVPSPGDIENEDYDPEDYDEAQYYKNHVYIGNINGDDDSDEETDYSDADNKGARRHSRKPIEVDNSKQTGKKGFDWTIVHKILTIGQICSFIVLMYIAYFSHMESASKLDGNRPYYRINQTAAEEGRAGETTRSVTVLVHLPNKARNMNLTEEILGGRICAFNETHAQTSEALKRYLQLAPAPPSRVHEHPFFTTLVNLEKVLSAGSRLTKEKEYMLCLYTELDVASNFLTTSLPLHDIQLFSNLYKNRLGHIRVDLQKALKVTEAILTHSKDLRELAAGCGGYVGQVQPGDPVCDFFARYPNVDVLIQRQYAARLRWYTNMMDLAEAADDVLGKTIDMLEWEAKKDIKDRKAPIRGFVQPFITAMGGLITEVKATP